MGHILQIRPRGFADRLDVGCEWKRVVKVDPKMFGLVTGRMELLSAGMGKVLGGAGEDGSAQPKLWAPPHLRAMGGC